MDPKQYHGGAPPQPYQGGAPTQSYQGGAPQQSYQGGAPVQPYRGGAPSQHYQGGAPPQPYQGGAPPQPYQGGAPSQPYHGGAPPQPYQSGAPPQSYQGGAPPQPYQGGGYGGPPPPGQYNQYGQGAPPPQGQPEGAQGAPVPSAPSLKEMDNVAGYEGIGFSGSCLPPPSYDDATRAPPEREEIKDLFVVSEDQAREALLAYVTEQDCYGKGAARGMRFTELVNTNAFHYTLESFCEARSTTWAFEPYVGQYLDTPAHGRAPEPWEVTPNPGPIMFKNGQANLEVPHTASVKACHHCMTSGWIQCHGCQGQGREFCTSCNGRGYRRTHVNGHWQSHSCRWCHGCGTKMCPTCQGLGRVVCTLCAGRTQLKCYIKLAITWINHTNEHIVERTDLPPHLIKSVTGKVAFQETAPKVFPVNHFPDQEVNNASQSIVTSHRGAFPSERLLMQRHQVRVVPVTQALYKWKDDKSDFFIYGFENKVYAPKYPQTCCWGCSIL